MKRWMFFLLLLCSWRSNAQLPANPPFLMEMEEVTFPDWPALHSFALAPNPFHYEARIQLSRQENFTDAGITDLTGRLVAMLNSTDTHVLLQQTEAVLKQLQPGVYQLSLENNHQKIMTKAVKIH